MLTSNMDWDPSMLDQDLDDNKVCFDAISDLPPNKPPSAFDEVGDYTKRFVAQGHDVLYSWNTSHHISDACIMLHTYKAHLAATTGYLPDPEDTTLGDQPCLYESHVHQVHKHPPNYQFLWPMFGWLPADLIKHTFEVTTQYAHLPIHEHPPQEVVEFPLLMSIGGMNWLILILSIWIHQLLTLEPPLPKFLLVWNPLSQISMPSRLISNSSTHLRVRSGYGEPPQSLSVIGLRWK